MKRSWKDLFGNRLSDSRKANVRKKKRSMGFERLQDRQMMAADLVAELDGRILRIEGTDQADQIVVGENNGQLFVQSVDILVNGVAQGSVPATDVEKIEADALAGDDLVSLAGDPGTGLSAIALPSVLRGGGDDDVLIGGGGDDQIEGGDGNDSMFGQSGDNVLRGDSGMNQLFDQDDQAVLRPTLVVVSHGFWPYRGMGQDEYGDYAEHLRDVLQARGSKVVALQIDWNSKESNEKPASELAGKIDEFLAGQSEAWDILFLGHSRGGILQHKVADKIAESAHLGAIYQISLDPTAALLMQDRFPTTTRPEVTVRQYDDGYVLIPGVVDGRKIPGEGNEYRNVHEEMQRDRVFRTADSVTGTLLEKLAGYLFDASIYVAAAEAAVDNVLFHTQLADWYMYGPDGKEGLDEPYFQDDIEAFIRLKANGNEFITKPGDVEYVTLEHGGQQATIEDVLLADLHAARYGGDLIASIGENYVDCYFKLIRNALIAMCPSQADKAVVRAFCDAVQNKLDHYVASLRGGHHDAYAAAEEFITTRLSPPLSRLDSLLISAFGGVRQAIQDPGSVHEHVNLGDIAQELLDFVRDSGDIDEQIRAWAEEARAQVDEWMQEQVFAVDNWAADKVEVALGWLAQQANQLESWAAGQFKSISQRAHDTVVQLRKAATQQADRMEQLADQQFKRVDQWLDRAVAGLDETFRRKLGAWCAMPCGSSTGKQTGCAMSCDRKPARRATPSCEV